MSDKPEQPRPLAPASGSATCGWLYMSGRKCGKPAIAKWTVMSSTLVCKWHAQEVNRMRMGKLTMLSPNDQAERLPDKKL